MLMWVHGAEMAEYFEKVRPGLAAGPEAREVDDFLLRPPTHPLLVPAREVLWRRVAHLVYACLPPYAHELYGRPAPRTSHSHPPTASRGPPAAPCSRTCAVATPAQTLGAGHGELGPGARPAPYKLGR
jgi:hypothetical protein